LASGHFVHRRGGIASRGERGLPEQFSGMFVESVELSVVSGRADEEQASSGDYRPSVILASRVAHALSDKFGKLAERDFPDDLAGIEADRVQGAPWRLHSWITIGVEEFFKTI